MFKNTASSFYMIKTPEQSGRFTLTFSTEDHEDWESLLNDLRNQYNLKIGENGSSKYPHGVSKDGLVIAGAGISSMQERFSDVKDFFDWIKINQPPIGTIFIFDKTPLQPQNQPVNNSQGCTIN